MSWHDGGSKLRAVRVAPGRLACEPTDDDYLRELAFREAGACGGRVGVEGLDAHPACAPGDVGADHNHGALGAKRQQSTCHNAPIDAM
jgi:hypothetical protein